MHFRSELCTRKRKPPDKVALAEPFRREQTERSSRTQIERCSRQIQLLMLVESPGLQTRLSKTEATPRRLAPILKHPEVRITAIAILYNHLITGVSSSYTYDLVQSPLNRAVGCW